MRFYDRYKGTFVSESSLPAGMDLGRYTSESGRDLTDSIIEADKKHRLYRDLLDDGQESHVQKLLIDFKQKVSSDHNGKMNIIPMIQTLKKRIVKTDFEIELCKRISNLTQISHQPHYLLQRVVEKVNASRAKRIPFKGYQYLSIHTEDWEQRSIFAFKPHRVLTEEYDLDYDIYENQLFLALVERCLEYLYERLAEVTSIAEVIKEYNRLLEDYKNENLDSRTKSRSWFEKVSRNLMLFSEVYKYIDNNYSGAEKDETIIDKTREELQRVYDELLRIRSSELCNYINKRAAKVIKLHDTNVLVNHKHYRYVRLLWIKLCEARPQKAETDLKQEELDVIEGLRAYSKTLFAYTISHLNYNSTLNYHLKGSYAQWSAISGSLAPVTFKEVKDKTFEVKIGKRSLRFVVVGNLSTVNKKELPNGTYLLCYSKERPLVNDRTIIIDPMDPNSMERLGLVLNRYLIAEYVSNIQAEYPYPQALKDFIKYIDAPWVHFYNEHNHYTYTFIRPRIPINKKVLSSSLVVGRDIRDDQKKELLKLVDEIENNYAKFVKRDLFCFHCQTPYNENTLESFNYMPCAAEDGFVLDISQPGRIILKNTDERYAGRAIDWGLDCMDFMVSSL